MPSSATAAPQAQGRILGSRSAVAENVRKLAAQFMRSNPNLSEEDAIAQAKSEVTGRMAASGNVRPEDAQATVGSFGTSMSAMIQAARGAQSGQSYITPGQGVVPRASAEAFGREYSIRQNLKSPIDQDLVRKQDWVDKMRTTGMNAGPPPGFRPQGGGGNPQQAQGTATGQVPPWYQSPTGMANMGPPANLAGGGSPSGGADQQPPNADAQYMDLARMHAGQGGDVNASVNQLSGAGMIPQSFMQRRKALSLGATGMFR